MNRRIRIKQLKNPLYSNVAFCENLARCEDECDGCDYPAITYLKRQLKKHGYSLSGWKLFEKPTGNIYIFSCDKKNKEISLYRSGDSFSIYVTDWKTHTDILFENIRDALESDIQNNYLEYDHPKYTPSQWKNRKRMYRYQKRSRTCSMS